MAHLAVEFTGLRQWQRDVFLGLKRFNVLVVHRRAGKTVLAILWLIARVAPITNGRGAYLAPLYNQAKRVAWDYLERYARVIPGTTFNASELKATFANGAVIYLLGADNPHAIRGVGLDAVVLDEVAQMGPSVWEEVIRPALSDKKGHALFIGTPFGMANLFYRLFGLAETLTDWYRAFLIPADTHCIDADELAALEREMPKEAFEQEYLCSWTAAIRGAFYGPEMAQAERDGRIGTVPHDPAMPVHTSWDLGNSQSSPTLWVWCWQVAGPDVRAIRAMAFQGASLPEVVQALNRLPYTYGFDYVPHDIAVKDMSAERSRQQILEALGRKLQVVPLHLVADGIETVKAALPRVRFDRANCGDGVEALKTYRTVWNDQTRVFNKAPLHSWESHPADAVRYFFMGDQGVRPGRKFNYAAMDRAVI